MNRLSNEKSSYLQHAANQKIDWYPWSEEAFELARREDKPVFLSTGAVWCHWCHVMAKESFEDEETARLLNEHFIAIKLDRDERPDIDRRYQQAVAAMGSGGGWPLSVFLTPDKQPFYGGTYFPPEDLQGRPGFKNVLRSVSGFYRTRRGDLDTYSRRLMEALKPDTLSPSDLREGMIDEAETAMLRVFDVRNGGFGAAPKFPMPGALEFLLHRAAGKAGRSAGNAAHRMLEAMAAGGFHDHLGGGFHRYSVDEAWRIPHFEKMADDNAGLLRNYVDGYAIFGDELFLEVARGIITFTRDVLSDPRGGFFASQDADVTPDDEGGYFTWTDDEFRKTLDPGEYALLSAYLLHDRGSMHHDPAKKVLFKDRPIEEIAQRLGKNAHEARSVILRGKKKLLQARSLRTAPFIDRTLYTSLNGMMISAFFHASSVLDDNDVKQFALKSLERILRERFAGGQLMHAENIPAVLDDYVHLIEALIAAYEATAVPQFLAQAEELMSACLARFYDASNGGFFDTEQEVLGMRLKNIEDVPHVSANAVAILLLQQLAYMTDNEEYRRYAEQSLKLFGEFAREIGVHAGSYFRGLDAFFRMVKLTIEAAPESELAATARALAGKAYTALLYGEDHGRVIPCSRGVCTAPVDNHLLLPEVCLAL
jgi:uncharacterized protein YyaL (SSP411 family)